MSGINDSGVLTGSYQAVDGNIIGFIAAPALPGDANLNGRIDPDDVALTDRGMAKHLSGWSNGDFNRDGAVDAADYLLLDGSFAFQSGYLSPTLLEMRDAQFGADYTAQLVAAIPEPMLLSLVVIPLFLLRRRR